MIKLIKMITVLKISYVSSFFALQIPDEELSSFQTTSHATGKERKKIKWLFDRMDLSDKDHLGFRVLGTEMDWAVQATCRLGRGLGWQGMLLEGRQSLHLSSLPPP